jgi:hypothetical protein
VGPVLSPSGGGLDCLSSVVSAGLLWSEIVLRAGEGSLSANCTLGGVHIQDRRGNGGGGAEGIRGNQSREPREGGLKRGDLVLTLGGSSSDDDEDISSAVLRAWPLAGGRFGSNACESTWLGDSRDDCGGRE